MEFEYKTLPMRVIFGEGKFTSLEGQTSAFTSILFLAEKRFESQAMEFKRSFPEKNILILSEIAQHVPKTLVDKTEILLKNKNIEAIIAMGGGSTIGLAKALVLRKTLPIIAIPTTYAGSEMTTIYGISDAGEKLVGRDDRVLPSVVIYDPQFTASMPLKLTATSAVNALAHLIEALYADNVNLITYQIALKGTEHILKGLQSLAENQELTTEANTDLLLGAHLAGRCLCDVNMALHHKAAHVLGGSFGMDHSKVHTVLLIFVLAYQWPGLDTTLQTELQKLFGSENPSEQLKKLVAATGNATNLKSIGFQEQDISKAARMIGNKVFANPVAYSVESIEHLLYKAFTI